MGGGGSAPAAALAAKQLAMFQAHIRSVELGALTIVLDLKRNKYLALPTHALKAACASEPAQHKLWTELASAEVIEPAGVEARRLTVSQVQLWAALLWAAFQVRRGRLDLTFLEIARCKLKQRPAGSGIIHPSIAHYRRWRPWYPAKIICLFDSLALMKFLLATGAAGNIEIVFGVRGMPFEAHCWLEWQGAVLNDEEDHCASFVEIARA
jgi:hypothetical protein